MATLIEVIFKGFYSRVDLFFLRELAQKAEELRFNSPELPYRPAFEEILNTINSNSYADLAISTNNLVVGEKQVPNVFVNVGRDDDKIDILYFFDLENLGLNSTKSNLAYLAQWMISIKDEYKFEYFICQMDAAAEGECYFDSLGWRELEA